MIGSIRYADYWTEERANSATTWLDVEEAKRRYETGDAAFTALVWPRGSEVRGRPRCAINFGQSRRVRVVFLNEHGSRVKTVEYDWRDGRLWRWITTDYEYPNDERRYAFDRATERVTATFEPNGDARVEIVDRVAAPQEKQVITFEDAPVQNFWLDRPPFEAWGDLLNPEYGIPDPPEGRSVRLGPLIE
ncbi:hypothetical protein [Cellulomonas oligotrophica]|uniref:Uncharacterized protein n=1 Tax=Cellulomonas oligotrophica TaxID=931536 RepID=A0A7Y9FJD0_9CELL|nr:hypothetical protein [Cellulomonas oligotrophica]NYD87967.1 hypothetical protein [Cellulomonas oligotrophica]GIG34462.1 hypothetical protein Col01nite_36210 [Cellulomonas oligotrophica]